MGIKGGAQAVVLLTVALTGCAYGEMRQVLRTSLAAQHDCPAIAVQPRNPLHERDLHPQFNNQYIVEGCGLQRTYTCPDTTGLVEYGTETQCTFVEGNANDPNFEAPEPAQSASAGDDETGDDSPSASDFDFESEAEDAESGAE